MLGNPQIFILGKSHSFHTYFILFQYYLYILGPGPGPGVRVCKGPWPRVQKSRHSAAEGCYVLGSPYNLSGTALLQGTTDCDEESCPRPHPDRKTLCVGLWGKVSLLKFSILIRNSPPRPPLEGNSLCAELWELDSRRKSSILIMNPSPDLFQGGVTF